MPPRPTSGEILIARQLAAIEKQNIEKDLAARLNKKSRLKVVGTRTSPRKRMQKESFAAGPVTARLLPSSVTVDNNSKDILNLVESDHPSLQRPPNNYPQQGSCEFHFNEVSRS